MFPLSEVMEAEHCPRCGCHIAGIGLVQAFEMITAKVLQGEIAPFNNKGYDIYHSELFPNSTFQVKYSRAIERDRGQARWRWRERSFGNANFYVLFGIRGQQVYPFAMSSETWLKKKVNLKVENRVEMTACRSTKRGLRNKLWECLIDDWPDGLIRRIRYLIDSNHLRPNSQLIDIGTPNRIEDANELVIDFGEPVGQQYPFLRMF